MSVRKVNKCVCDDVVVDAWTAKTFECPVHGTVTIDRRLTMPVVIPMPEPQPYTPHFVPYHPIYSRGTTSDPLPLPSINIC